MEKRDLPLSVFYSKAALRIAKEAHKQACDELDRTPRHKLDPSNPNHPDWDNNLFGYDEKEFLSKQYR